MHLWAPAAQKPTQASGSMDKWFDAACQPLGPAWKVAQGRPIGSFGRLPPRANPGDVGRLNRMTPYAFPRPPSRVDLPWAMTLRVLVNNAG